MADKQTTELSPLNGAKTHPLTAHARNVLAEVARKPVPTQTINAGVINRFRREALTEPVNMPSPFAAHKGGNCSHEQITEAGRKALL